MHPKSPLSDRRALLMAKFEALLDECDLGGRGDFGEKPKQDNGEKGGAGMRGALLGAGIGHFG